MKLGLWRGLGAFFAFWFFAGLLQLIGYFVDTPPPQPDDLNALFELPVLGLLGFMCFHVANSEPSNGSALREGCGWVLGFTVVPVALITFAVVAGAWR
jgi:hypothetical protein